MMISSLTLLPLIHPALLRFKFIFPEFIVVNYLIQSNYLRIYCNTQYVRFSNTSIHQYGILLDVNNIVGRHPHIIRRKRRNFSYRTIIPTCSAFY